MDDRRSTALLEDRLRGWMADEASEAPPELVDDIMNAIADDAAPRSRRIAVAPMVIGAGRYVALAAAVGAGVAAGMLLAGTLLRPSEPVGATPEPAPISTPGSTDGEGGVPAGSLRAEPSPVLDGRAPSVGPSGVWFESADGAGISRYRPGGDISTVDLAELGDPTVLVRNMVEAFGALWVADEAGGRLVRVDLTTGSASELSGLGAGTVAAGRDAIWHAGEAGLVRIDPVSVAVLDALPELGGERAPLAYAANSLWVGLGEEVVRVNEVTLAIEARIPVAARALTRGDGAIWAVTDTDVVRIDPSTNAPERRRFVDLSTPIDEAPTLTWSDGRLFVVIVDRGSTDVIQLSYPGWAVVGRTSLARQVDGIAVGFGSVWVATEPDGRVWQMVASP